MADGAPKLTAAHCAQTYRGDIDAESALEYLIAYRADGAASFVGLERVRGTLGGRRGSFVLRHEGEFRDGVAALSMTVVPGTGTGQLVGLAGRGEFESPHREEYEIELEWWLEGDDGAD